MTAADLVAGARALIEPLTGHTPGEWEMSVTHPTNACANVRCDYTEIATLYGGDSDTRTPAEGEPWGPQPIRDANARLTAAAPVMRDTIEALLDDRDALMQRIEALEAALRDLLPLADEGAAQPGHTGSCGPWESCDSLCMDAAHDARAISAARAALQADEAAQ